MKYSFLGFGLIMAGLFGIVFLVMFESITINNETEYYVLKEAMEAAMLESVDVECFRNSEIEGCGGVVKISEQKFVENFTRRFATSVSGDVEQYKIQFYDIIESPPKASVVIEGLTGEYSLISTDENEASFGIGNSLSGILEHKLLKKEDGSFVISDSTLDVTISEGNWTTVDNKGYVNENLVTESVCKIEIDPTCTQETVNDDTGEEIDVDIDVDDSAEVITD